ncbi:MAG TPA: hypothetical protein VEC99_06780 [Clostridia bacterium]|nr:hypothetical protein [Clostridia bacterium]
MSTFWKFLFPFLLAFVACPAFIVLHEVGHYAVGSWFGGEVRIHYARVTGSMPKDTFTWQVGLLQTSAGPLVNAVMAVAGLLWLYRLRKNSREAAPTAGAWLATIFALNAGRWLRSFTSSPSHPEPKDEALISQVIGLPEWFLPYLLGGLAVIAVFATIRLHPPGGRLVPFVSLGIGGVIGIFVWMRWVGPFVLP